MNRDDERPLAAPGTGTAPPLAVVGMACLFPKADGVGAYWANIKNRVDAITPVPPSHWRADEYLDPDPKAPDRVYTARGGFLDPVPFPPGDFGIAPNDLEATDTAQLLALLVARQALLDAGYDLGPAADRRRRTPDRGRVGVILGVTGTLELVIPLGARLGHPRWRRALKEAGVGDAVADDVVRRIGESYVGWQESSFPGLLGNVVAGRVANRLDLGGTNCVVDAACASSLGALHLAALELQSGRADAVITGGVDTFNDVFMYMCFSKTPALSPTGDSRPFDAAGDGTILGEGLGMVVLKRLADAEHDGDRVYAVVRGVGASSDGKGNAIYAPKAAGQAAALRSAYEAAGVSPATVELLEAHGTGTKVGDATELAALTEVYGAAGASGPWCALGSVKSQIGHTKAAAGAAGLIKAIAALHHKVLPPTLKVREPLEALRDKATPFYVNTEMRPWLPSPEHPRRAAVSAFGFGGSNFHCVLEEAGSEKVAADWDGDVQVVALAAETTEALQRQLAEWSAEPDLEDFRARAARSRKEWRADAPCRLLLVAQKGRTDFARLVSSARLLLQQGKPGRSPDGAYFGTGPAAGKLAALFPGQGAQYAGMLRDLACLFPAVLNVLAEADRAFGAARPAGSARLNDFVYPRSAFTDAERESNEAALRATDVAQPALGAVSLGAWRVLEHFGVVADAAAGHSYGELTALCASGRLTEAEFHRLSSVRGKLMAKAAPGAMLAVPAGTDDVAAVLAAEHLDLTLANKNAPAQTVLSGRPSEIERAAAAFAARDLRARRLEVGGAFHSPLVSGASKPLREALEGCAFPAGRFPVYANTTAALYPDDPAAARELLAGQLARPVEFVAEIEALYRSGVRTFVEVGPGARLTGLVGANLKGRDVERVALDASSGQRPGTYDLACALALLAARGHRVDLTAWDGDFVQAQKPADPKRPSLTVPLCGANYVKPRPPAPARTTVQTDSPRPANNGPLSHPPQSAAPPPVPAAAPENRTVSNRPTSTPAGDALAQALQLTRDSLAAVQKMQEQTADLHRQFLEGQESAQRSVQALIDQQQRLLQASLGLASPPAENAPVPPAPPTRVNLAAVAPAPLPDTPEPSAPPAERAVAPAPAPEPPAAVRPSSRINQVLLEVVAEKTGYPADMLGPDMALDADLGIDSIKRVEILSALQERLPDAPAPGPEHLGTLHTLRHIADFLAGAGSAAPPDTPAAPAASAGQRATRISAEESTQLRPLDQTTLEIPQTTLDRTVLRLQAIDARVERAPVNVPPGAEVWITPDDDELAGCLDRELRRLGYVTRLLSPPALREQAVPEALGGLVVVAPADLPGDDLLRDALKSLQHVAHALCRTGKNGGAVFGTVSRQDGAFSLRSAQAEREPVDGGLAGLCKTAGHEWPEVRCKALDVDPGMYVHAAAVAIADELFRAGPTEVGIGSEGRVAVQTAAEPLSRTVGAAPFRAGDVVVVSGGARGVTAEVAVALARHFRLTLVLLGRSPAPRPEPEWLSRLSTEAEIKRELAGRANGSATPKAVGEQYAKVVAAREIRQTLERIESAGGKAVYLTADVRQPEVVAGLLAAVREEYGPVRGIIHGAGVLADSRIEDKTEEQFDRVYSTKVQGLRSLLSAVDPSELRSLVLFSSMTGRFGRAGQADYAAANEVLNKVARQLAARLPQCRVLALNWGPWDGGMVTPSLKAVFARERVPLIAQPDGAAHLVRELCATGPSPVEVVLLGGPLAEPAAVPAKSAPAPAAPDLPVAFERVVDLADHPVLESHVLDGRPVLPVVLMLEWLAHAALHQNPGLVFHGCNELRVLHGVILDDGPPPELRLAAGKAVRRGGLFVAPAELRSTRPGGAEVLHARAEVVLASDLPTPLAPAAPPAVRHYPRGPDDVYRSLLFHGKALQGIETVEGCGEGGIVVRAKNAPAPASWLRNPLRQRWLTDPLVLDVSFQAMVLWCHDRRAAPSLPCLLRSYRQFRRTFPVGGIRVVAKVTHATQLHALADIDYLDADGRLVARLEGYECVIDASLQRAYRRNRLAPAAVP